MSRLIPILLVLAAGAAEAQAPPVLATIPNPPVAGAPFVVRVTLAACYSLTGVTVNGNTIDVVVHFEPLCIGTPAFVANDVAVGPLPAGNYTVRLMRDDAPDTPAATLPIAIAADVPALDTSLMIALAAVLGLIAIRSAAR